MEKITLSAPDGTLAEWRDGAAKEGGRLGRPLPVSELVRTAVREYLRKAMDEQAARTQTQGPRRSSGPQAPSAARSSAHAEGLVRPRQSVDERTDGCRMQDSEPQAGRDRSTVEHVVRSYPKSEQAKKRKR